MCFVELPAPFCPLASWTNLILVTNHTNLNQIIIKSCVNWLVSIKQFRSTRILVIVFTLHISKKNKIPLRIRNTCIIGCFWDNTALLISKHQNKNYTLGSSCVLVRKKYKWKCHIFWCNVVYRRIWSRNWRGKHWVGESELRVKKNRNTNAALANMAQR